MTNTSTQQKPQPPKSRITRALSFAWLTLIGQKQPAPSARKPLAPTRASSTKPAAATPKPAAPQKGRDAAAEAEGRRRERERCRGILQSDAAQRNMDLARSLAFDTDLTPAQALALIEATPAAAPRGSFAHPDRAARNPKIGPAAPALTQERALGKRWDRAFDKANRTAAEAAQHVSLT